MLTAELEGPSSLHKILVGHVGNATPILSRRQSGEQIAFLKSSLEGDITAKNFSFFKSDLRKHTKNQHVTILINIFIFITIQHTKWHVIDA